MADVNEVLAANRAAVLDLVAAAESSAATLTTPGAPLRRTARRLAACAGAQRCASIAPLPLHQPEQNEPRHESKPRVPVEHGVPFASRIISVCQNPNKERRSGRARAVLGESTNENRNVSAEGRNKT